MSLLNASELREISALLKELGRLRQLEVAFDPRMWTADMHKAWHTNIPDTIKAFAALREAAMRQADNSEGPQT